MSKIITVARHHDEAENFVAYLNAKGYEAEVSDKDSGDDNGWLWEEYVHEGEGFWPES